MLDDVGTSLSTVLQVIDMMVMELGIGTRLQISDIIKMQWSDIESEGINVKQGETGTDLWIPFTEHLTKILSGIKRQGFTMLADEHGRRLRLGLMQKRNLRLGRKLGLEVYNIHGWRYTAAEELAATGATDAEIAAITGHKSLEMVAK